MSIQWPYLENLLIASITCVVSDTIFTSFQWYLLASLMWVLLPKVCFKKCRRPLSSLTERQSPLPRYSLQPLLPPFVRSPYQNLYRHFYFFHKTFHQNLPLFPFARTITDHLSLYPYMLIMLYHRYRSRKHFHQTIGNLLTSYIKLSHVLYSRHTLLRIYTP